MVLGDWIPAVKFWLACAALLAVCSLIACARRRGTWRWTAPALVTVSAAWAGLHGSHLRSDDISQYAGVRSQLARVTGRVVSETFQTNPQRGAFGGFAFQVPGTLFELAVDSIEVAGEVQRASGTLLVKIEQADDRPRPGMRVAAMGWLRHIDPPGNPGEIDYQQRFHDAGIRGRLTLTTPGNLQPLADPPLGSVLTRTREYLTNAARASLHVGLESDTSTALLLGTILLGERGSDVRDLDDSYRRVGLAHLLSISGTHLGIMLALLWAVLRLVVPHPAKAALLVLIVLLLYLLAVPLRVPIIRAGIMAGIFCGGYALGRNFRAIDLLALACVVVLVWSPIELFSPGFQLSFGVVTALLLFTRPLSLRMWPEPLVPGTDHTKQWLIRVAFDYLAVNIVAFVVSMPLVAFHFQMVTPLAAILSLMALPVVTAVLGLGYLKIGAGLLLPAAGAILAGPLEWTAEMLNRLVDRAGRWPGSYMEMPVQPSVLWTCAVVVTAIVWLEGRFNGHRAALAACCGILAAWLTLSIPGFATSIVPVAQRDAVRLNMISVGDGSCFLLRIPGQTIMFDCGSQQYLDAGERSVVPALRSLGVRAIDTLMLSHADIDHFNGCIDVADRILLGRVLMPPQMLADARDRPDSALAYLIHSLKARNIPIHTVGQGWRETFEHVDLEMIWPPLDYSPNRSNDHSLVLSVRAAGRRVLLNGDIQQEAISWMLNAKMDLRADVCDLAHHGSYVEASPRWLEAVDPELVLQSSGPARLINDRWRSLLQSRRIPRCITARDGMATVAIDPAGGITWSTHRGTSESAATPVNGAIMP